MRGRQRCRKVTHREAWRGSCGGSGKSWRFGDESPRSWNSTNVWHNAAHNQSFRQLVSRGGNKGRRPIVRDHKTLRMKWGLPPWCSPTEIASTTRFISIVLRDNVKMIENNHVSKQNRSLFLHRRSRNGCNWKRWRVFEVCFSKPRFCQASWFHLMSHVN